MRSLRRRGEAVLTRRPSSGGLEASAFTSFSEAQYSPYLRFPNSDEHTGHPGTLFKCSFRFRGGLGISIPNKVSFNAHAASLRASFPIARIYTFHPLLKRGLFNLHLLFSNVLPLSFF